MFIGQSVLLLPELEVTGFYVWVYVDLYVCMGLGVHMCTGAAWTLAFRRLKPTG